MNALHNIYPSMKANECQVVKTTKSNLKEYCEAIVEFDYILYPYLYGYSRNKKELANRHKDCKYAKPNEYLFVRDIKNLPNILSKYVFNVRTLNEIDSPTFCVTKSSVRYNHSTIDKDAVLEKIKTALKNLNDNNETYLEFMKDEDMQNNALRIYRFVGDKMLKDFQKYYDDYKYPTATIARYSDYWKLPIEYEVINWNQLSRIDWIYHYKDTYDSTYNVKCYNKSPQDSVTIDYGKYQDEYNKSTMTCAELKNQMELFEKVTRD